MSYQFEDDSALEELLNQQLDRRKPQPMVSGQSVVSSRPPTTRSVQKSSYIPAAIVSSQSALNNSTNPDKSPPQAPAASSIAVSKSKLASWLDGKSLKPSEPDAVESQEMIKREIALSSANVSRQMLEDQLGEEQLQELSKQRLIKLITGEIVPAIKALRQTSNEQSEAAVTRLKDELQFERDKVKSLELRHMEQMKLAESRWVQLNRQLESRLELTEHELSLAAERHRTLIVSMEEEHKQQIDKLKEGYQAKLADEKLQAKETLKRREDLHNLELESKLKVNCDLVKLETIFDEWHKMIQTTIKELDLQFKSVENLLDKQTIEINSSNSELAKKSRVLSEHYEKFELQGEQLSLMAREMNQILPQFSRLQQENESLTKQTGVQLEEFLRRNDQLRARGEELEQLRDELAGERAKLSEERFELALSSNRVAYKEERLAEMVQSNEAQELVLADQMRNQMQRDARLDALQMSLDIKSNELKQQNYDLHLTRKKLTDEADKLTKLEVVLEKERKSVQEHLSRVQAETQKLASLRDRARKELNQLKRLQKSLVCSLCLDRLFKSPDLNTHQLPGHNKLVPDVEILEEMAEGVGAGFAPGMGSQKLAHLSRRRLDGTNLDLELAKLNRYIELDSKQLEAENKYVQLLSV